MRAFSPVAIVLLLPLLPLAHGGAHGACDGGGLTLSIITIGSGRADDPLPTIYVDDRNYLQGNGLWIYLESNGLDRLQRGGTGITSPALVAAGLPPDDEICYDDSPNGPDTLIF